MVYRSLMLYLIITVHNQLHRFSIRFRQDLPADWSASGCSTTYQVVIRQVSEMLYIKRQQAISGWLYWLAITYLYTNTCPGSLFLRFQNNTVNRHLTLCIGVDGSRVGLWWVYKLFCYHSNHNKPVSEYYYTTKGVSDADCTDTTG